MKRFTQSKTLDYCPETGEYVSVTRGVFFTPVRPFRTTKKMPFRHSFSHEELRLKTTALYDARKRCQANHLDAMAATFEAFARVLFNKWSNHYL
jgi:hypothetical protein